MSKSSDKPTNTGSGMEAKDGIHCSVIAIKYLTSKCLYTIKLDLALIKMKVKSYKLFSLTCFEIIEIN